MVSNFKKSVHFEIKINITVKYYFNIKNFLIKLCNINFN